MKNFPHHRCGLLKKKKLRPFRITSPCLHYKSSPCEGFSRRITFRVGGSGSAGVREIFCRQASPLAVIRLARVYFPRCPSKSASAFALVMYFKQVGLGDTPGPTAFFLTGFLD